MLHFPRPTTSYSAKVKYPWDQSIAHGAEQASGASRKQLDAEDDCRGSDAV